MKTTLTILLLIPLLVFGQVKDTIKTGQSAIMTLGTTDYVKLFDVPGIVTSKNGVLVVDRVHQVQPLEDVNYWSTVPRTPKTRVGVLYPRGQIYTGQLTVTQDSIDFGSWGDGSFPVINSFYWDSDEYPSVTFRNLIILDTITPQDTFPELYSGTKYYVSNDGDDANPGTKALPFATIDKINDLTDASTFQAGDAILFNSEDEWMETLTMKQSGTLANPITIGAYGLISSQPKIYGSKKITGWTVHSGNIYKASFTPNIAAGEGNITQLFVNGKRQKLARYPDNSYLSITSIGSTTQFRVATLAQSVTGSNAIVRPYLYMVESKPVTSNTDTIVNISSAVIGDPLEVAEGVFFVNKYEFINTPGEWYYDSATDIIYFWAEGNVNPSTLEVRGSIISEGIVTVGKAGIVVQDLDILQQKTNGINMGSAGSLYITIKNCTIDGQEGYGIKSISGSYWTVDGNTITNQNGGGILTTNWDRNVIKNNTFRKIGLFENWGILATTANNGGSAIQVSGLTGFGNTIEFNNVDSSGYNGIYWGTKSVIQYNYVTNSCLSKADGGAIYTGGQTPVPLADYGSTVLYNIVDSVFGNPAGSKTIGTFSGRKFGFGIYIDENAGGVTVNGNTILRCGDGAIFLHRPNDHIVTQNTTFNSRYGYTTNKDAVGVSLISDNTFITGRATDPDPYHRLGYYEPRQLLSYHRSIIGTVTINNNTYINGFPGVSAELVFRGADGLYKDYATWKTYSGKDATSTYIGTDLESGYEQRVVYNASPIARYYSMNGAVAYDEYGVSVPYFTLYGYTSKYVKGTNLDNIE